MALTQSQESPSPLRSGSSELKIIWAPQPGPQKLLIDCPVGEIFFGGARGGGKTDGVLGKYGIKAARYGKSFNAIFFRKEMPQQDDLIERAKDIYLPLGAQYRDRDKLFEMPGGGRIRFRPLERMQDAEKYQGQSITDAVVEEAGNYPLPAPIDRLNGILRSAHGVPTQLILTGNPGGAGQGWIKQRYVDPAPKGLKILSRELPNGKKHKYVFIPSKVINNQILLRSDPDYVSRLYLVGGPQLVRAWLEGDWNAVEGAFFPEFCERHIIEPREIPLDWPRIRAMDWGSAKPFCVGWYAVADGSDALPRGSLVKYSEWYGMAENQPNVGLKLTAEEVAAGIVQREKGEPAVQNAVIDPSACAEDGGPSIRERMWKAGAIFGAADNKRVSTVGAMGGWDQVRARLKGDERGPQIYFFSTCVHTIRTFPLQQHDPIRAEDLDTEGEDHALDETRYACMSRPYLPYRSKSDRPKFFLEQTADEVFFPKDPPLAPKRERI